MLGQLNFKDGLVPFLDDEIRALDLRIGNICNLSCTMCYSGNSNRIYQQIPKMAKHFGWSQGKVDSEMEKYSAKNYDWSNDERAWENIISGIDKNLLHCYLAGGEPMLMKANEEFLSLLSKKNPECTIRVNTNLSKTSTKIFDQLCHFKNVHWTVSVEAIEKEYEYIRHHGNWQDFTNNLKIIKTLPHRISFNMLYFLLNYRSLFDCVEYFQKLKFHDNSFVIGPLHTPEYLNVLNLPKHIVEQLITILKNKINQNKGFLLQNSYQNLLQHLTETDFHANIDNTKKGLKKMDQRRHLDSKEIFPTLYKEVLV